MAQIGNLHQAGQDLAEARERAARAEERETFLRERLEKPRHRLEAAEQATRDVDEPRTFLGFRRRRPRDPRHEGAAPSTRDTA